MKRLLGLLACVLIVNGCDDGDLVVGEIDFSKATVQKCTNNNLIYKIQNNESLLLDLKDSLKNDVTLEGKPTIIEIGTNSNRVIYRFYNGAVSSGNICDIIPPATPNVTGQWTGSTGKIEITTTTIKKVDPINNSSKITGYNHNIIFKNITFQKPEGPQTHEIFVFGDYISATFTPLAFGFKKILSKCDTNLIYDFTTNESFTLNIDPDLLSTKTLDTPKTGSITSLKNQLTYQLFTGSLLTADYFCKTTDPQEPAVTQKWNAVVGVPEVSGMIEVTTTTNGTGFKHTIVLKKVTLKRGNSDFKLGDSYLYGTLLTTK